MIEEYLEERFPFTMDATTRSSFVSCPRKFFYEHILSLVPPSHARNIHLVAGAAFAKGCEVARKSFYGDGLNEETSLALGLGALISSYGDDIDPTSEKSLSRVSDAFLAYFGAIPNNPGACNMGVYKLGEDPYPPYMSEVGPGVEFSFTAELPGLVDPVGNPITYHGRFDQIVSSDYGLLGCDEKTAKSFDKNWAAKWQLRGQFLGYIWGAKTAGIDLKGILVRGIVLQKTQFHFPETVVLPPDQVVANYVDQLHYDILNMLGCWENEYWPQNFSDACTAYSGCPYAKLCESPEPERWYSDFAIERWNPVLARREVIYTPGNDDTIPSPFEEF